MRILLHCNGGGSLGVGHVMRSLALAEAGVAAGHDVVVAGRFEGTFLQGQLAAAPVEVMEMPALLTSAESEPDDLVELVRRLRPDVLHVDSYQASARLRDLAASAGVEAGVPATVLGNIVVSNIEDGTFGRRPADVVVDPTLGAELSPRPDDGSTWLLLGSRYSPLRRRVLDASRERAEATEDGQARAVLVVMGGTDPSGMAPVAVELLARTGLALNVTVVTVGQNAQRARAAAQGSALSLNVLPPVDDLPSLMSDQDLVISAAGTSVWELFCLGVPTVVAWTVENQREGYERVVAAGAAIGLGGPELSEGLGRDGLGRLEQGRLEQGRDGLGRDGLGRVEQGSAGLGRGGLGADSRAVARLREVLTDGKARGDLAMAGRHLVDGLGAWRVVRTWEMALRAGVSRAREPTSGNGTSHGLVARPATLKDSRLLWLWRNDPLTRAGSRSTAEVPWDEHLRWLAASLAERDRRLYLVSDAVGAVGTVRWDRVRTPEPLGSPAGGEDHEWEVSVTVAPQRRGQSLARPLLRAGERALSEETSAPPTASARVSPPAPPYETPPASPDAAPPAPSDAAPGGTPGGGSARGAEVTAYLAVVQVDNLASIRLFETSGYLPDLPPDPRGFMRYRKTARVT
jgi:spore coat polysaccharide biosynthesis predicted glycosyltransferase SpsG